MYIYNFSIYKNFVFKQKNLCFINFSQKKVAVFAALIFFGFISCFIISNYRKKISLVDTPSKQEVQKSDQLIKKIQTNVEAEIVESQKIIKNEKHNILDNQSPEDKGSLQIEKIKIEDEEGDLIEDIETESDDSYDNDDDDWDLSQQTQQVLNGKYERVHHNGTIERGLFENDQLKEGIMIFSDGTSKRGTFVNGQLHGGEGEIVDLNGRRFKGMFVNDKLHGEGEIREPNKNIIAIGKFEGGVLKQGQFITPDGIIRRGIFKDGQLEGEGEMIFLDGSKKKGIFKNDELI